MGEGRIVKMCCECRRVQMGDRWHLRHDFIIEGVDFSHGYCPDCFENRQALTLSFVQSRSFERQAV